MIISHKYRFIFVKTAKTAGTSIEVFLSQHCGKSDILTPIAPPIESHTPRNHAGFYNHIPAHEIRQIIGTQVWDSYFKFCVERNPWDKVLSGYFFWKNWKFENMTFERYLANGVFPVNYIRYTEPDNPQQIMVNEVLRYEQLTEDLGRTFKQLGIPFSGSLGVNAKSEFRKDKRHYRDIYTTEQAAIVEKAFSQEIAMHGYRF
ncbi:MAG: sulfotransferase family protein [Methylophilales bacterium]|nr:sulfotransferase family protein [Methylophilales bacterium]